MNISLDLLQTLDAIDRLGSHAAAAQHLHRVPSAITHAIAKAESLLGHPLFERRGRRAVLTEAGRCLLDDLRLRSNQFGWTLTPPGDQLFVEAGQTVTLTIGITAPGVDVLQFATAASPFGYSLVPLNALP